MNALFWLWNKFMHVIELLHYCSTARFILTYHCKMYSAFQPVNGEKETINLYHKCAYIIIIYIQMR